MPLAPSGTSRCPFGINGANYRQPTANSVTSTRAAKRVFDTVCWERRAPLPHASRSFYREFPPRNRLTCIDPCIDLHNESEKASAIA
jgi:hypothetical protein